MGMELTSLISISLKSTLERLVSCGSVSFLFDVTTSTSVPFPVMFAALPVVAAALSLPVVAALLILKVV